MRRLRAWDQRMSRDRVEPLLFIAWLREFNRQILADKLGPLFDNYWGLHPDVIQNILASHPDWCDNRETREVETCPQQLGAALDRAIDGLAQRLWRRHVQLALGQRPSGEFSHPIWSRLPVIAGWLGVAIPDDGSFDTIDNATMFAGGEAAALHRGPRHLDAHDRRYGRSGGRAVHGRTRPVGQSALTTLQRPAAGLARCRLCAFQRRCERRHAHPRTALTRHYPRWRLAIKLPRIVPEIRHFSGRIPNSH